MTSELQLPAAKISFFLSSLAAEMKGHGVNLSCDFASHGNALYSVFAPK
jgi:hypothetical protein